MTSDMEATAVDDAAAVRRRVRAVFAYAVLALSAGLLLLYRVLASRGGDDAWQTGEWLINYGGGFVRRGLFGQIFLAVTPGGSVWLLVAVQALLHLVVFVFAAWVLHRNDYSWSVIALVCGPAALGFVGWDPAAGSRKEVLAYVALSLLVWGSVRIERRVRFIVLSLLSLAVFVVAVFSWEATAFFLPAFLYILLSKGVERDGSILFRRGLAAAFVVVGGAGLALGALFHGTEETAAAVCDTIREHGFTASGLCSGAIDAIGWTSAKTLADVAASFPLYVGYLPLFALAVVPVVASAWFRIHWRWAALIAIALFPLFVIVIDYGRWISMIVMAVLFCIAASRPGEFFSRVWTPLATVLYVSLWGLPAAIWAGYEGTWPWIGMVPSIINNARLLLAGLFG